MSFSLLRGKCLVVAEVAQAHDGSLGMAHAYVDAVAQAGADAIKFQTHIAAAESSADEPWRVRFSYQDQTRFDYWRRMEFTEAQWTGLRQHAADRGLGFLSSPFSVEAAEMLHRIGVPAWKIASGEINNGLLLDFILATRLPVMISTGMSSLEEIDRTVAKVVQKGVPIAVMQCTSKYPCLPHEVGLNMLSYFRERYASPVGISDHSGTIYPSLASATLGAEVVEVHVTLSRESFGPDVPASVTTSELRQLTDGVRFITSMLAAPVDKEVAAEEASGTRRLFTKSIIAAKELEPGTILARHHLGLRKPGTGIPADKMESVIGCRVRCPVKSGEFLSAVNVALEMAAAE